MPSKEQYKEFIRDWYYGLFILGIAIFIVVEYYSNPDIQPSIQKVLPYNTVFNFVIILLICQSIVSMSNGIAKLVMKNRRIVAWLVRQKEKQDMKKWRNEK